MTDGFGLLFLLDDGFIVLRFFFVQYFKWLEIGFIAIKPIAECCFCIIDEEKGLRVIDITIGLDIRDFVRALHLDSGHDTHRDICKKDIIKS